MIQKKNQQAVIITGGPGMGKTTLIGKLGELGYGAVKESGRTIIQSELDKGGVRLPWLDREGFAEAMFEMAVNDFNQSLTRDVTTFFDRGIGDVIGYLQWCKIPVPTRYWDAAKTLRYCRHVFMTPPWREIYQMDSERKQSFSEAIDTFETMKIVYKQLDYHLVELPKVSADRRANFIVQNLEKLLP